ncbi:hypothetical protein D918_03939 [Trichuris suis]|nr:hypothetical protein D918_03939 [Trichuris suis]
MGETDEDPLLSRCQWQVEGDVAETSHETDGGYFSLTASTSSYVSSPLYSGSAPDRWKDSAILSESLALPDILSPTRKRKCLSSGFDDLFMQYDRLRPVQSTLGGLKNTSLHGLSEGQFCSGQLDSSLAASEVQCSSFASNESVVVEREQQNYTQWPVEETVQWDGMLCTPVPEHINNAFYFSEEVQVRNQCVSQLTTMGQYLCNESFDDFVYLECSPMVERVCEPEVITLQQEDPASEKVREPLSERKVGLVLSFDEIPDRPANKITERNAPVESFKTPKKGGVFPLAGIVRTPTPVKQAYAAAEKRYGKIDRQLLVIPPTDEDIVQLLTAYGIKPISTRRKCLFPYMYSGPEALQPAPMPYIEGDDLPENWLQIATGATPVSKHMLRLAENVLRRSQR